MQKLHPVAVFTLAILLFEHCATVTLTRLTQQRTDAPRPIPCVVVFLTEALKLLMSMCLELTHCGGLGSASTFGRLRDALCSSPQDTLRLSVPAVLYTIQNLTIFVALGNLEVVIFQVLYQTKLLLTAVLSVLLLGRRLTPRQWFALLALTFGVICVELSDGSTSGGGRGGSSESGSPSPAKDLASEARHLRHEMLGVLAALLAALLSSLAGVYFEAIVKKAEAAAPSLWVRNVQLCVFTLPIAAATVGWQWGAVRAQGLVLDPPTVLLMVLNASGGLLVAAVIKYGDNILKNFTTACSVIIGTLISVVLFDFQLTVGFAWGSLLVASSAYVFATSPEPVAPSVMRTEAESGTPLMAARENTDEETRSDESADGWRETGAQTLVRGGAAR